MKLSLQNVNFEMFCIWRRNRNKNDIIQDDDINDDDDVADDDYDYDHDKQKPCSEESRLIITGLPTINSKQQLHQRHIQYSLASVSPTKRGVFQPV
jgi:hypothetical protein